jgi:uncharacterized protein (DUF2141 family)
MTVMVEVSSSLGRPTGVRRLRNAFGLLMAAALFSGAAPAGEPATGASKDGASKDGVSLTVRVSQLESDQGRVAIALFASAQDFPDQKRAFAGQLTKISGGRASVTFANVRPGVYAVAVLHDENENSKMDFNFLGMPLEGYGFSNDAAATFGPPSFEAASFKLSPRNSYVPVKMRYFL